MFVIPTVLIAILVGYWYLKRKYNFWNRVGLTQIEPEFFYGNIKDLIKGTISVGDQYKNLYNEFKAKGLKHGGFYELLTPTYLPTDLDIIKCILQKDFHYFMNHVEYVNEEMDPLTGHLLTLEDEKWKKLRAKLTPTFSSGRTKMIFPIMVAYTEGLTDVLKESARVQDVVDIQEVLQRFTSDVIGSAAFGLDCNCLKNPHSKFREMAKKIFKFTAWKSVKRTISITLPKSFLTKLKFKLVDRDVKNFFMGFVQSAVDYREKNNIYRKDLMHTLLQLKNRGKITDDEDIIVKEDEKNKNGHYLTLNELTGLCFGFFLAGTETSGTTMAFALLELSLNPDIQNKLREEIKAVLKNYDNQMTYEAIMEMHYLDKVVNETLRKHAPIPMTGRICNTTYRVPNTDIVIQKGARVRISILGIHRDPEYYPEPELFDPERFNEENKTKRPPYTFLPFGEGPRICIGTRLGLLQIKVGLTSIIGKFSVSVNSKTKFPIKYASRSIVSTVDGDIWLNIKEL